MFGDVFVDLQHSLNGKTPLHYVVEKKNAELLAWFVDLLHYFTDLQLAASTSAMSADSRGATAVSYTHLTLPTNREV